MCFKISRKNTPTWCRQFNCAIVGLIVPSTSRMSLFRSSQAVLFHASRLIAPWAGFVWLRYPELRQLNDALLRPRLAPGNVFFSSVCACISFIIHSHIEQFGSIAEISKLQSIRSYLLWYYMIFLHFVIKKHFICFLPGEWRCTLTFSEWITKSVLGTVIDSCDNLVKFWHKLSQSQKWLYLR